MDYIDSLPSDTDALDPHERATIDSLLNADGTRSKLQTLFSDLKDPILMGFLFIVMNTSQIDTFLRDTVPYAGSSAPSLLVFKGVVFAVLVFLINNQEHLFR